jgi:hypothetical protein
MTIETRLAAVEKALGASQPAKIDPRTTARRKRMGLSPGPNIAGDHLTPTGAADVRRTIAIFDGNYPKTMTKADIRRIQQTKARILAAIHGDTSTCSNK